MPIAHGLSLCSRVAVWPTRALDLLILLTTDRAVLLCCPESRELKSLLSPFFVLVFLPSWPSSYQASVVPLVATVLSPQQHLVSPSVNNTAASTINTLFAECFHRQLLLLASHSRNRYYSNVVIIIIPSLHERNKALGGEVTCLRGNNP